MVVLAIRALSLRGSKVWKIDPWEFVQDWLYFHPMFCQKARENVSQQISSTSIPPVHFVELNLSVKSFENCFRLDTLKKPTCLITRFPTLKEENHPIPNTTFENLREKTTVFQAKKTLS